MATLGSRYFTLRDVLSGIKPNGEWDYDIIELIAQENALLKEIPWRECSNGREDFTTYRTSMPKAVFRMFYEGVKGSKSSRKRMVNSCATASTSLKIDWRMYQQSKHKEAFLADEQKAHVDSLGQLVALAIFYGDVENSPKGINGFAKTLSEYGTTQSEVIVLDEKKSSFNVFSAGGNANRRSAFLVGWSDKSAHGLYPEGSSAGIQLGQVKNQYLPDGDGGDLDMGIQEINWDFGLNIRDTRYCGRIGDIDIAKAFAEKTDPQRPNLVSMFRRLISRVKSEGVTQRLYMTRMLFEAVSNQFAQETNANAVHYADLEQKKDANILGVPVSFCDCMNIDEPALVRAS